MRPLALVALALAGCVSDLAVGVTQREVRQEDAAPMGERDAGMDDVELDAGDAPFDAEAIEASAGDAAVRYWPCPLSNCWLGFTVFNGCSDGSVEICASTAPDRACESFCL
ncbi:MAG TPA: hypothetical protein VI299_12155 [Polyangiales bacterium]